MQRYRASSSNLNDALATSAMTQTEFDRWFSRFRDPVMPPAERHHALNRIIRGCIGFVRRIGRAMGFHGPDLDDGVQEVLLHLAVKALPRYVPRPETSFVPFLRTSIQHAL